jgi:hypothetical protein
VILEMDGHGSWWTPTGLFYLMDNQVFPCFLLSLTTSMWLQPNDYNINQRIYECMEKGAHSTEVSPIMHYHLPSTMQ